MLVLDAITMRWPGHREAVLDGIDLLVPAGSITTVTGANGAGKTTLLRIIAGLLRSQAGRATVCGLDSERDRRRYKRRIGLLPAGNTGLYARLNVDQNLAFWARLAMMSTAQRRASIAQAIDFFDLHDIRGRRVDRLSMGQRQRLRLALTFLHEPTLVLLDEPFTSLDSSGAGCVGAALERACAAGGAAIVCSPEAESERLDFDEHYELSAGHLHAVARA